MTITELRPKPSALVSVQVETDYILQLHDCTSLAEFDPNECAPCTECGHAECRHPGQPFPKPLDTTGLTDEQVKVARMAELYAVNAAMTASPCKDCACNRMRCGDECQGCDGDGTVEDERTGRTFTCEACYGRGVIA